MLTAITAMAFTSQPGKINKHLARLSLGLLSEMQEPVRYSAESVFISHSGVQKDGFAVLLRNQLRLRGVDAFMDERDIAVCPRAWIIRLSLACSFHAPPLPLTPQNSTSPAAGAAVGMIYLPCSYNALMP